MNSNKGNMTTKDVLPPVSKDLLIQELTEDKLLRKTNYGNNELYVFTHKNAPNLMREVGRLRELSFRAAGGGTGEEVDIDELDVSEDPYQQLIVWDPQHREILGGYRFYIPSEGTSGQYVASCISTSHYFSFSDEFLSDYMPYTIELGRSFVQPLYQSTGRVRKGIYALDNLWDGLGALMVEHPDMRYFLGKVTMYGHYNKEARNTLLYFLNKYFPDKDKLVWPIERLEIDADEEQMQNLFCGGSYEEDYRILSKRVRSFGENIPPLINAYMNLSPSLKVFGTMVNSDFGKVEETGILITINDLYEAKIERHVNTYQRVRYFFKKDILFKPYKKRRWIKKKK
jgi:hypothetical protein